MVVLVWRPLWTQPNNKIGITDVKHSSAAAEVLCYNKLICLLSWYHNRFGVVKFIILFVCYVYLSCCVFGLPV